MGPLVKLRLHRHTDEVTLKGIEAEAICRALDVLIRVANNECTNAQREASDAIKQIID